MKITPTIVAIPMLPFWIHLYTKSCNAKNTKAESITLIWLTDTEQMPILSNRENWKVHTVDPLSDFDFVQ